ncbi:MAG: hypothetical protein K1X53_16025 [Candidatus Sumerlaeaceae bacterium]|nr:hypothetical protein [Candidatus Sumerlaeaceae bacterium]
MQPEAPNIEMEVFRCGNYGDKGSYGESELDSLARDYNPELQEAPLTVDHARSGPALGWVSGLRRAGDRLVATIRHIPETARKLLREGAFKKRSIELVKRHPDTGRPYLRAVSLLGAASPEVRGLREVAFQADEAAERIDFENDQQTATHACAPMLDSILSGLASEGYCVPAAHAAALADVFAAVPTDTTVRFAEQETPVAHWLREFLRLVALRIPMGEEAATARQQSLAAPLRFDDAPPESPDDLHRRTLARMGADPGLTYAQALAAVARETAAPRA